VLVLEKAGMPGAPVSEVLRTKVQISTGSGRRPT
jgi:hypothetical protein